MGVTAQGRWVQDKEFGLQFKAEMLTSTAPTTREGIEKYLGSGMVKGIGRSSADFPCTAWPGKIPFD
jgi:exodeoxyribonuclease V alpha subunit